MTRKILLASSSSSRNRKKATVRQCEQLSTVAVIYIEVWVEKYFYNIDESFITDST